MQAFTQQLQASAAAQQQQFDQQLAQMQANHDAQRQAQQGHIDALSAAVLASSTQVQGAVQAMTHTIANPPAPPPPPVRPQQVRAPPVPPKWDHIRRFDTAETDPVQLAMKYRVFRKDCESAISQYAQSLAYHYRSTVEAFTVGAAPEAHFADTDARDAFAQLIFDNITNMPKAMFTKTDARPTIVAIDVTAEPKAVNRNWATQTCCDSVRLLEDFTFTMYLNLIDPPTTKFRLQTFEKATHTMHGNPPASGTACIFDCDENYDAHDPFAGIRLQLEYQTYAPTGDTTTDLRVKEDLRLRIHDFYRLPNGDVDRQKKDDEAQVADIISAESNPDLFSHLKQMLTNGDAKCRTPATLTKYIHT